MMKMEARSLRGRADVICWSVCALVFGFVLAGASVKLQRSKLDVAALRPIDNGPGIAGSGFALNSVYPTVEEARVRGGIQFYGSWMGSDASTGSAHSGWYDIRPNTYIFVSGYPNHVGLNLSLETLDGSALTKTLPLRITPDPAEHWRLMKLPLDAVKTSGKFRISAMDQATTSGGWVGFSTPFTSPKMSASHYGKQLLLVLLTAAAALLVFLAPGLLLRASHFRRKGRLLSFIWVPVPGFTGAVCLGLLDWIRPSSHLISIIAIALVAIWAAYALSRTPVAHFTSRVERKALFTVLLLIAIAVAKSVYSLGPAGELYGNTISRTLEVGDRSDSRVPYHVVQLIALRERPDGALAAALFRPWNFSSRGPLAGLAASPIVLASPVKVPAAFPDREWMIFDPEGFMAYRIAMIVMAASCLLMVFGLSARLLPEEWALFAFLVTVGAPFVIHEIYFTWPKLEAASFVLLAVYLLLNRRWFTAGVATGIGYLCHPSALLFVPALVALEAFQNRVFARAFWARGASMIAGLAIPIALWRVVNRSQFDQGGFLSYFLQADRRNPTFRNWLEVRADSLLNTLVPLNLFLFHSSHPAINVVHGRSPAIVNFFFQDWTGLPFGIGIVFFICFLRLAYVAFKKFTWPTVWLYVMPFLLFTVYWGAASTGMLREGLHTWVLALLIGVVIVLERFRASEQKIFQLMSWALLFRGVEIILMLLGPTIWTRREWMQQAYAGSDSIALAVMVGGAICLSITSFQQCEFLRRSIDLETPERAAAEVAGA